MSKSQSDIVKILAGGTGANVPTKGEFVFIKNAVGKIRVIIHNEPVEMEAGDLRRVEKPFESFEIINLSSIDQRIEIVAGFGEYNRLVVRGDISSFSSLLDSSGVPLIDNRIDESFVFCVVDDSERNEKKFESIDVGYPALSGAAGADKVAYFKDGIWVSHSATQLNEHNAAGEIMATFGAVPNFSCFIEHPVYGLCVFKDNNIAQNQLLRYDGGGNFTEISTGGNGPTGGELYAVLSNGNFITCQSTQIWFFSNTGTATEKIFETNFTDIAGFPHGGGLSDIFPDPETSDYFYALRGPELYRFKVASEGEPFSAQYIANVLNYSGVAGSSNGRVYFSYSLNAMVNGEVPKPLKFPLEDADIFGKASINKGVRFVKNELTNIELIRTSIKESISFESSTINLASAVLNGLRKKKGLKKINDPLDYVYSMAVNGEYIFNGGVESAKRRNASDLVKIGSLANLKLSYRPEVLR